MSLRDIKKDLLDRIAAVDAAEKSFDHEVLEQKNEFARRRNLLREMLAMEGGAAEQDAASEARDANSFRPGAANRMESEILGLLAGGRPMAHAAIKEKLLTLDFGPNDASFGRMVHGTLMSMRSRDLVENIGNGTWQVRTSDARAA